MVCTPEDLRSSTEATMSASGSLGRNSFEGQLLTSDADSHSGLLRTQDLQEAKDQIIVEVADTLGTNKIGNIGKFYEVKKFFL